MYLLLYTVSTIVSLPIVCTDCKLGVVLQKFWEGKIRRERGLVLLSRFVVIW